MNNFLKKDSDLSTAHSMVPCIIGYSPLWTSTESQSQQSCLSKSLSLKMATPPPYCQSANQLGFNFQDQDSSSTQSTGQSYPEVLGGGESNPYGQNLLSMKSGYNGSHAKLEEVHSKSTLSMRTQDYVFPPQVDYRQEYACVPLAYPDPHNHGSLATYGPHPSQHHKITKMLESENYHPRENNKEALSKNSCSDITTLSNDDDDSIFQQQEFRFSVYPSHVGRPIQGVEGLPGGNQHCLAVIH